MPVNAVKELEYGSIYLISAELEFTKDNYLGEQGVVGMRWVDVAVPPSAIISNAYIRFTADEVGSNPADVRFWFQPNGETFKPVPYNISDRLENAFGPVDWEDIPAWETIHESGGKQRTLDLSGIIQEIIDTAGWRSGNSLVIMAESLTSYTGPRTAESYDGSPSEALCWR